MNMPDPIELTDGQWVTKPGGLRVWVPAPRRNHGRAPQPTQFFWDTATARRAHANFYRGERDPWTVEGERVYQRNRKRRQRARKAA